MTTREQLVALGWKPAKKLDQPEMETLSLYVVGEAFKNELQGTSLERTEALRNQFSQKLADLGLGLDDKR
jgi:hypothetical protein